MKNLTFDSSGHSIKSKRLERRLQPQESAKTVQLTSSIPRIGNTHQAPKIRAGLPEHMMSLRGPLEMECLRA